MNIFFNISHPAHVHFFKNAISKLEENGHNIIVGARNKGFTVAFLEGDNIDNLAKSRKLANGNSISYEVKFCKIGLFA